MEHGVVVRSLLAVTILILPVEPMRVAGRHARAEILQPELLARSIQLTMTDATCVIELRPDRDAAKQLVLDLRPPCYLLYWRSAPPARAQESANAHPIGEVGDPMAWRYNGAGGVTLIAVIGDPIPADLQESDLYRLRVGQGMKCAGSVQGVALSQDRTHLTRKRGQIGVLCVELGMDEKDFWLLANP